MTIQPLVRSIIATSLFALCGCGGSPLIGRWTTTNSAGGSSSTGTLSLNGDGTASLFIQLTGGMSMGTTITCSGPGITLTGHQWAATPTMLTISGTPACSGMITCLSGANSFNITCAQLTNMMGMMTSANGSYAYALSNNNDTLTLTGPGGAPGAYVRTN